MRPDRRPGVVLNALVLFNTCYMDAAVTQLREEDVARLSPFVRHHINSAGTPSSFRTARRAAALARQEHSRGRITRQSWQALGGHTALARHQFPGKVGDIASSSAGGT
nr:Tn3 family transposase [Streptomyces endocoffeicus]